MNEALVDAWRPYRAAVERAFPATDAPAERVAAEVPEGQLDEIARESELLTERLEELLPASDGEEREELETAALAAAGIDVTVAANVLVALREEAGPPQETEFARAAERAAADAGEIDPLDVLIARANQVFEQGEVAEGAEAGSPWALTRSEDAIEELVDTAAPVTSSFGQGMLMVGASNLLGAFSGFDALRELVNQTGGRLGRAARLLELGVKKMLAIIGPKQALELATDWLLEQFAGVFDGQLQSIGHWITRRAARADFARDQVAEKLATGHSPSNRKLDKELDRLCARFAKNMRWAKVVVKGLAICSPVVIVVGAGVPGQVALAGANWAGAAVCLFALADRLDTVPWGLGWVEGVPTLVERC